MKDQAKPRGELAGATWVVTNDAAGRAVRAAADAATEDAVWRAAWFAVENAAGRAKGDALDRVVRALIRAREDQA